MLDVGANAENQRGSALLVNVTGQELFRLLVAQLEAPAFDGSVGKTNGDAEPAISIVEVVVPIKSIAAVGAGLNESSLDVAHAPAIGGGFDPTQKWRPTEHEVHGSPDPLRRLHLASAEAFHIVLAELGATAGSDQACEQLRGENVAAKQRPLLAKCAVPLVRRHEQFGLLDAHRYRPRWRLQVGTMIGSRYLWHGW